MAFLADDSNTAVVKLLTGNFSTLLKVFDRIDKDNDGALGREGRNSEKLREEEQFEFRELTDGKKLVCGGTVQYIFPSQSREPSAVDRSVWHLYCSLVSRLERYSTRLIRRIQTIIYGKLLGNW